MMLLRSCLIGIVASGLAAGSALALITPIELTPSDVSSASSSAFTVLPTDNPAVFGLTGPDVAASTSISMPTATPSPAAHS